MMRSPQLITRYHLSPGEKTRRRTRDDNVAKPERGRGRARHACPLPLGKGLKTDGLLSQCRDFLNRLLQAISATTLSPSGAPSRPLNPLVEERRRRLEEDFDWDTVAIMVGLRRRAKQTTPISGAGSGLERIDEVLDLGFDRLGLNDNDHRYRPVDAKIAMVRGGGPITRARARAVADLIMNGATRSDVAPSPSDRLSSIASTIDADSGTLVLRHSPPTAVDANGAAIPPKSALAHLRRDYRRAEREWIESTTAALSSMPAPSLVTVEKAATSKLYLEQHFRNVYAGDKKSLASSGTSGATGASSSSDLRLSRTRLDARSYTKVKTLGRGAFGVVSLVRETRSGELLAMKRIDKVEMIRMCQAGHVKAERDVLARAAATDARYIARLVSSFQDSDNLYLVMEYMAGGDLLQLLIDQRSFSESFTKFYVAEMILAIAETHALGFIHRDIKPDNFLFDRDGHIKLADFGLSTDLDVAHDETFFEMQRADLLRRTGLTLAVGDTADRRKGKKLSALAANDGDMLPTSHQMTWRGGRRRELAFSLVGTCSYMAPEVISNEGYTFSCDWWSLGVIVYEMLFGTSPFAANDKQQTRRNILNFATKLQLPSRPSTSGLVKNLIRGLLTTSNRRLGSFVVGHRAVKPMSRQMAPIIQEDVELIKAHPWFEGVAWSTLHEQEPPFRPRLDGELDTKYFEDNQKDEVLTPNREPRARDILLRDKQHGADVLDIRREMAFKGYTFRGPPPARRGLKAVELAEAADSPMADVEESDVEPVDAFVSCAGSHHSRAMSF